MTKRKNILERIVAVCEEKKAFDLKVHDIKGKTSLCDYFIVASVHSKAQMRAILDEIRVKFKNIPLSIDGNFENDWVVLDLGDFFLHLFLPQEREKFKLDELWEKRKKDSNIVIL